MYLDLFKTIFPSLSLSLSLQGLAVKLLYCRMLTVVANASCTKLKLGAPLHFTQAMGTKTRMQQIRGTTQLRSTTTHVGCSLGSQKHAKTPYKPPECRMIFYTILKGSLLTFDLP